MEDIAIKIEHVDKVYRLYHKSSDRLRDGLGLSKKKDLYREHYALRDVSFEVKRGETVGIIGTNGSGKSTILKIITGVLNETAGNVVVDGRISALLELGAGFNGEYTGIQNIYLNGTMCGFTKEEIDDRLQAIVDFADIGDYVNQPVKTYSSGMFVRLAFAVAINIDPEILIVDEALSVGDVFFQTKCYKKFKEFKKKGKTILFVSHDLGSISQYCDRVILLDKGVKKEEGSPKQIIDLYKKLIVKQTDTKRNAFVKKKHESLEGTWKSNFAINPKLDEYGTGEAEIIDFAIVDEEGELTNCIEKGTRFTIKSKVKFNAEIEDPIFTYSFKNVRGVAITGTNTMFEKMDIGIVNPGEIYVAEFSQSMFLQGGEYLLSISCTGYQDGEFNAYHRLYDVCTIMVISDKNTVGFYDMNSKIRIERVKE
jgi:teichoic acid transport system ATP-binding protein